jgi:hypothetical protein
VNLRLKLTSRHRLILERGEDPDEIAAEVAGRRNTLEMRAAAWANVFDSGHVLSWRHPAGGIGRAPGWRR